MPGAPRDPGAPASPSRAIGPDGHDASFWNDAKRIARARRAARSRHPVARTSDPAGAEHGRVEVQDDPVEEFAQAMIEYRRQSGRMFPTWCEVLEVLRSLGYQRLEYPVEGHDARLDPVGLSGKGESP